MSQVFSIRRVKHSGAPVYLGEVEGEDTWSAHPERIIRWMCDGYRFRFNQHRALRKTTVWTDDPDNPGHRIPVRDDNGDKVLAPLGDDPIEISDKEARQQFPHLAALPAYVLQHPARVENTEWWSAIKRRRTLRDKRIPAGSMPRFRSAKAGDCRFGIWYNGGSNAILTRTGKKSGVLTIKGQNPAGHRQPGSPRWKITITVRLSADVIDYTSVEVDWTRKKITTISPPPPRNDAPTGAVVGIDRGITHTAATSDGHMFDLPQDRLREAERLKKSHQKAMARSRDLAQTQGRNWRTSKRRQEHKRLAAKHARTAANIRRDFAHQVSHRLVSDYDLIALEDLDVRSMTRSARGTAAQPGKNVAQKAGLNRAILASGWSDILAKTEDKANRAGKHTVLVPAPYTSQRCAECGHTAVDNRKSQAVFACTECGHTDNADTNAARNILASALQGRAGPAGRQCQTGGGDAAPAVADEPRTPALTLRG